MALVTKVLTDGANKAFNGFFWDDGSGTLVPINYVPDGNNVTIGSKTDGAYSGSGGTSVVGGLKGLYTAATSITTALGNPFQAGGSIGNTSFGAKLQDNSGSPIGTSAAPIYIAAGTTVTFKVDASSSTSLPLPIGAAKDTSLTTINSTLGTPFQVGGSVGNTAFGAKLQDASGNPYATTSNPLNVAISQLPTSTGAKTSALSLSVAPATDATFVTTGNVASGTTDSGNPVKVGAVYNSVIPTLTSGQRADLQLDSRGSLAVTIRGATGSTAYIGNSADATVSGLAMFTVGQNQVFNGSSWDRVKKPNVFGRAATSSVSGTLVKGSASDLSLFWGQNGSVVTYLQIYNKATAPTIGTDVPALTYPIPANGYFSQTIPNGGAYFSAGIGFAFTTDAAGNTAAAASAVTAFNIFAS